MSETLSPGTPAPDALPPDAPAPDPGLGDTAAAETAPDPDSPLRDASAEPLPEALLGDDATDRVILSHTYDGIREYDNPMPGWWVALFWAGIIFAPVYMLGVHVFGYINTYQDDFAEAGERLDEVRADYAATGPSFKTDDGALREYAADAQMATAGAVVFGTTCASCHGAQGEGGIGPNLADAYWLHGAEPSDVYRTISEGVLTAGMPAWDSQLSEETRAQAMAFVFSLRGTDPSGAKAPQGDLVAGL